MGFPRQEYWSGVPFLSPEVGEYACLNHCWIIEKSKRVPEKHLLSFVDYAEVFVWITANCGRFFKRWECQTTWPASWEICMQVKKQKLKLEMEWQTGSKWGNEYVKAVGSLLFSLGSWCTQDFFCVCALQESVSLVLGKFFNQIPLPSKDKFWTVWKGKTIWPER